MPLALIGLFPVGCRESGSGAGGEPTQDGSEVERALERIANVGYLGSAPEADTRETIVVHERDAVQPGLNLYVSAHANEALLMDLEGRVVHRWARSFEELFPAYRGNAAEPTKRGWRRARLLPGGELLAIQEGTGLVKLDRDSEILWTNENRAHHDLDLDGEGRILVLTHDDMRSAEFPQFELIRMDGVEMLSPSGETLDRIPLDEAYRNGSIEVTLPTDHPGGDIFHANTIVVLDGQLEGRHPGFKSGNLLLSLRNTHELAVMDRAARKIVWTLRGAWRRQHEPSILPDGKILLLDNEGGRSQRDSARILEIDPLGGEILNEFSEGPGYSIQTKTSGTVYRLPNGNFLMTDSNRARAFEVTPQRRLVWHFESPHASETRDSGRAFLFDVVRIGHEEVQDWL